MALTAICESTGPVELTSGIDALYLSGRGELPESFLGELDRLKSLALDTGQAQDWQLGGYPVRVKGGNLNMYRYAVKHELGLFGFTPSDDLPAVRVQPTSVALHSLGPDLTVLWARNVLDAAGLDVTFSVSRLDLHSDWQRLWVDADERRNFVTYSDKRARYEVAEEFSGLNFGKRGGSLYARIYDKSRQAADKGDDWWPDVWGRRYDPERPVLRVEFEFTRDGLREFGVDTPEEAFAQVGPLWAYATGKWLSLRAPSADETRSRWPVDLVGRRFNAPRSATTVPRPIASEPARPPARFASSCRRWSATSPALPCTWAQPTRWEPSLHYSPTSTPTDNAPASHSPNDATPGRARHEPRGLRTSWIRDRTDPRAYGPDSTRHRRGGDRRC